MRSEKRLYLDSGGKVVSDTELTGSGILLVAAGGFLADETARRYGLLPEQQHESQQETLAELAETSQEEWDAEPVQEPAPTKRGRPRKENSVR
jgi:hypothetical protein